MLSKVVAIMIDDKFKEIKKFIDYKKTLQNKINNTLSKIDELYNFNDNIKIQISECLLNDEKLQPLEDQLEENLTKISRLKNRYNNLIELKNNIFFNPKVIKLMDNAKNETIQNAKEISQEIKSIIDNELNPIIQKKYELIEKIKNIETSIDLLINNYNGLNLPRKNYKLYPGTFKHDYLSLEQKIKNEAENKKYEAIKIIDDSRSKRIREGQKRLIEAVKSIRPSTLKTVEEMQKKAQEEIKQNAIKREKIRNENEVPELYKPQNENLVIKTGEK
jgi:hypothetical protein